MEISYKLEEINKACEFILNNSLYKLILFEGDLGLGKTTLIKNLCQFLGSSDNISSPTFPILNIYQGKKDEEIFHADLYRVDNLSDLNELGFIEILDNDSWVFVEWPNKFKNIFKKNYTLLQLKEISNNERKIKIINHEF